MHNDLIIKNKEVSRIFRKSQEGEVIFFTLLSFFSPFLLLILVGGGGGGSLKMGDHLMKTPL